MGNNLSMGQNLSSEANGIDGCAGCGLWLPPANPYFDFIKVLQATDTMTYCFWTPTETSSHYYKFSERRFEHDPNTFSRRRGLKRLFRSQLETKLFKYFRL
ncbi:hypothetical protein DPMN_016210 [Dreissena polymorpha]|uniref:Uncharacterized protein n=1 Tax=Dreissena polymorpha TaxID=45954 RepID=A0A9D4N994_DREPO|nr:hypothetical protein DPMN_016210 [Dreissena polymorpha]